MSCFEKVIIRLFVKTFITDITKKHQALLESYKDINLAANYFIERKFQVWLVVVCYSSFRECSAAVLNCLDKEDNY